MKRASGTSLQSGKKRKQKPLACDTLVESLTRDWESFDPGEAVTHVAAELRAAFLLREAEDHRLKALAAKEKMGEYNTLRNEADRLKGELEKGREAQEAAAEALNRLKEEQRLLLRDIGHHEEQLQTNRRQFRETVAGLSLYLTQPGWEGKVDRQPGEFQAEAGTVCRRVEIKNRFSGRKKEKSPGTNC